MGLKLASKISTVTAFLSRWHILHDDANNDVPGLRFLTLNHLFEQKPRLVEMLGREAENTDTPTQ